MIYLGDSPVRCTITHIKTSFVTLAKISLGRRARQVFQRQSLCLLTVPFLIDNEQLGCCGAILRFALWLGVRQMSFN